MSHAPDPKKKRRRWREEEDDAEGNLRMTFFQPVDAARAAPAARANEPASTAPEAPAKEEQTLARPPQGDDLRRTMSGDEMPSPEWMGVGRGRVSAQLPQEYRPVKRPPMAVLQILDDNQRDGESVRLRDDLLRIGRAGGDVVIPHDLQISGNHAEIERVRREDGRYDFVLRDLQSTNGIYVHARWSRLKDGDQFRIGFQRFVFQRSDKGDSLTLHPPSGAPHSFAIIGNSFWLGKVTEEIASAVHDDPLLEANHAVVLREGDGRRLVKDANSRDGLWVRVKRVTLIQGCLFQLGEQRFRFGLP